MALDIRLQMALRQPPITQFDNQFVSKRMVDLLSDTYMLLGFKIPMRHELTLLAAQLTKDLYESYGFLRMEEVSICFELGAKEEFGDYVGLNYRTFSKWLKGYNE